MISQPTLQQSIKTHRLFGTGRAMSGLVVILLLAIATSARADIEDARKLFRAGKYAECITACAGGAAANPWDADWGLLKIKAELMTGQYPQALQTLQTTMMRQEGNIELRLAGVDVLQANNRPQEADRMLTSIRQLAVQNPGRYSSAEDRVVLGRTLLRSGADPRQVLELFYDSAKKVDPAAIEPYLATASLAMDKQDFALAAEAYIEVTKRTPDDPDGFFGLARAYESSPEQANIALAKALELNPRHVDSLLYQIDNLIDQEEYDKAESLIKEVLAVNPKNHKALSYRAVLSHLGGDRAKETQYRAEALASWQTNPEVDFTIGEKLSQKYRFEEGAAYQRRALQFDPSFKPAKLQLCQDLLRLGKEEEGWKLAAEAFKDDQYSVLAYNLSTLHDNINKFKTIQNEHFIVRMDANEAQIYGQRVLKLLEAAKEVLSKKYNVQLTQPVTVEVFNQQKDFAIRTFGLPGGAGYLGVCFGSVITVNSPATRGANPANWEAIVWHEFCHVITLAKTKNKMPRWLSEGISVYEERQKTASWGQVMNPQYREFIMQDKATPVSRLSSAFLKPASAIHLNFAYYESNMVVEYVIDRFGMEALKNILTDLGNDVPINTALAKYTEPIEKLDANFAIWLKKQAEQLAPNGDLARPKDLPLDGDSAAMAAWNKDHPNNFWGLLGEGRALIAERKWKEAVTPLQKAVELYPNYGVAGGPYLLMAAAYKEMNQPQAEREMLEKHLAINSDAIEPRMRMIELAEAQNDWKAVQTYTDQVLAINPLVPAPHRYLATAAKRQGDRALAIEETKTLLLMNPLDAADQHYNLATMLVEDKTELQQARREVLLALEQAPRFVAAHRLLLEIAAKVELEPPAAGAPSPGGVGAGDRPAATRPTDYTGFSGGQNNLPATNSPRSAQPATEPVGNFGVSVEEQMRLRRQQGIDQPGTAVPQ